LLQKVFGHSLGEGDILDALKAASKYNSDMIESSFVRDEINKNMKDATFHVVLVNRSFGMDEELIELKNTAHDHLALTMAGDPKLNPIMNAPGTYRDTMLFDIFAGV
jgi:hypothetical protein